MNVTVEVEVEEVTFQRYTVLCDEHGNVWSGRSFQAAHDSRYAHEVEHLGGEEEE